MLNFKNTYIYIYWYRHASICTYLHKILKIRTCNKTNSKLWMCAFDRARGSGSGNKNAIENDQMDGDLTWTDRTKVSAIDDQMHNQTSPTTLTT